jgi:glycosyltransferase involved in cell wall biosynthesis
MAASLPDAQLVVIGDGSRRAVIDRLVAELPRQVTHHPALAPADLVAELDAARALVLPSWPEGLGRVCLEAFARGRPVIGTNGGGIPDIVTDGHDGILIPRADTAALIVALERVLDDKALVERLGQAARETYTQWHQTPQAFAQAYRDLVDRVLAGAK